MLKRCMCGIVYSFLSCFRRRNKRRKISTFSKLIYAFSMLIMYVGITAGLYVFYSVYIEKSSTTIYKRYLIAAIEQQLPRVKEVNCSVFLAPPDSWNDTLQNLSEIVPSVEVFDFKSCFQLSFGGFLIPPSEEEEAFPIAFSIMVYNDVERMARLLRAIYRSSNVYCIHVDGKSSQELKDSVQNLTSCYSNVIVPPDHIKVYWGSSSVLEAEMACLKALWRFPVKWLAFINLTGEEFPLKTNLELVEILRIMGGQNDVWIDPCTLGGSGDYTSKYCLQFASKGFAERWANLSTAPYDLQPYKGQIHVVLSRDAVDYVLHNRISIDYYNWVKESFIPDEAYFSTLNSNPSAGFPGSFPYPRIHRPSIARLKLWQYRDKGIWTHCGKYLRDICMFSARELPLLTTSRQLFANKFKSEYKPLGYSCLEEWYFQKVLQELKTNKAQIDLAEYHRIFHQHNISRS